MKIHEVIAKFFVHFTVNVFAWDVVLNLCVRISEMWIIEPVFIAIGVPIP